MAVSVRYIVDDDVDAAIPFYTDMLYFRVEMHPGPGFVSLSRGDLHLLLNKPGAGGAGQLMPDGRAPAPGGWLRFQIEVSGVDATVERLKAVGGSFRSDIITGNGGKQNTDRGTVRQSSRVVSAFLAGTRRRRWSRRSVSEEPFPRGVVRQFEPSF